MARQEKSSHRPIQQNNQAQPYKSLKTVLFSADCIPNYEKSKKQAYKYILQLLKL